MWDQKHIPKIGFRVLSQLLVAPQKAVVGGKIMQLAVQYSNTVLETATTYEVLRRLVESQLSK